MKINLSSVFRLLPEIMALVQDAAEALADDGRIDPEERKRIEADLWALVAKLRS